MLRRRLLCKTVERVWTTWTRSGGYCDSAGTTDGYDCDGTSSIYYYQEVRYYQFPDGTGRTATEYRSSGEIAYQGERDGQCGYSAPRIEITYYGFSSGYHDYLGAYNSGLTGSIWQSPSTSFMYYASEFGDTHATVGTYCTTKNADYASSIMLNVNSW